jgi:hypothetical protein
VTSHCHCSNALPPSSRLPKSYRRDAKRVADPTRRLPRAENTIGTRLRWALNTLPAWADEHQSLPRHSPGQLAFHAIRVQQLPA